MDSLLNVRASLFAINIAQVLLEEYTEIYKTEMMLGEDLITSSEIDKNAVNLNTWFEISPMNMENENARLLYGSREISDTIYGRFVQYLFSSQVVYEYTVDSVKTEEIYELAENSGNACALCLFDDFMNRYVQANLAPGEESDIFIHYNFYRNKLQVADTTCLIEYTPE
jgi:hypothetical protein